MGTASQQPLISLSVRNATLGDVVFMLAAQSGKNIIADAPARLDRVTLRVRRATFEQILEMIAHANGLHVARESGVYLISGRRTEMPWKPASRAAVATSVGLELSNRLPSMFVRSDAQSKPDAAAFANAVALRFVRPSFALRSLRGLLPPATYIADDQHRTVVVVGGQEAQSAAKLLLRSEDDPIPRALLDVTLADAQLLEEEKDIGQELSDRPLPLESGAPYSFTLETSALERDLHLLLDVGRAKVLGNWHLLTLPNHAAALLIGQQYRMLTSGGGGPQAQLADVGVRLTVRPLFADDGSVTTELHVEYSTLERVGRGSAILATRNTDYKIRTLRNESIVLGGVFSDLKPDAVQAVPLLSRIPVLGPVFASRVQRGRTEELFIAITPRIIGGGSLPSRSAIHERGVPST